MHVNARGTGSGLREVLDVAIRGKELATGFFSGLAQTVEDVELRRCLRRLAQEEWDHRKILLKHRRELFGRMDAARLPSRPGRNAFDALAPRRPIRVVEDLRSALRTAILAEEEVHHFFANASRAFEDDRAVKVFLRILAEQGLAQVEHLREALGLVEEVARGERSVLRAIPAGDGTFAGEAAQQPVSF